LIGAGSLAAGGAAALGTGATSTFSVNDRTVGANIVSDSSAVVKIVDTTPENDIVDVVNGELEIDFANGGGSGINVGSVVEIGNLDQPNPSQANNHDNNDSAFSIQNQATAPMDLEVAFEAGQNYNSGGSQLTFSYGYNGDDEEMTTVGTGVSPGDSVTIYDQDTTGFSDSLNPGQRAHFALEIDADQSGSSTSDNLSGALNITATQPESDN
jgi:hypothetical protein